MIYNKGLKSYLSFLNKIGDTDLNTFERVICFVLLGSQNIYFLALFLIFELLSLFCITFHKFHNLLFLLFLVTLHCMQIFVLRIIIFVFA